MLTLLIIALVLCFISGSPLFSIMLAGTALGAFFSSRGFDIQFNGAINKIFSTSESLAATSAIPDELPAGQFVNQQPEQNSATE